MSGLGPTSPIFAGRGGSSGGSPGSVPRDVIWADLRVANGVGNNGTDALPYATANNGLNAVPNGGTLFLVGGDASAEAGVNIGARSLTVRGLSGQTGAGGLTAVLPTLTYAITSGTQRLAFQNVSVALVHSGTVASLTACDFKFCPTVTLTAGGDSTAVFWVGDAACTFSGSGGAAYLEGGNIAGYAANTGSVTVRDANITGSITSPTAVLLLGACTFATVSITAPSITLDEASYAAASAAGVTFSSSVHVLVVTDTPQDIGTANSAGSSPKLAAADHVHKLPFPAVNTALGTANAPIGFNGQRLSNLGAPTSPNDGARLVDLTAAASGLKVKTSALVVATANQATRSGTAQTIDGVALNTVGMRVLLIAQTTATQNGLWLVQSGAWIRPVDGSIPANDFSTGSSAAQSYVLVTSGTANAGNSYFCTNAAGSDVVDTANLNWTIFNQPPVLIAGAGLVKTGSTLDVVANADGTIVVGTDDVKVGVIGNSNLADNTIALARLVNAGGQNHFLMRKSASAGAWEDGTVADAQTALGIVTSGALKAVRAATTANITLSGTQTVDGVALIAGDRCLAKNQTTGSQNGVYVVAAGAWARSTDLTTSSQFFGGLLVPISEGTANGNRVAILTTDDPITVGTTSLTFAMDRIVPVASVAPQDITNGAAQIGTAVDAARADHVHTLTFAVWAALAAVASTAISVNSQKITNLGAPTVATDAARLADVTAAVAGWVAPGNPGDNFKIAYANAGALAYRAGVTTPVANQLAFAVEATNANLQFEHATIIARAKDSTGAAYNALLRWGVAADEFKIGGGGTTDMAVMRCTGRAAVQYIWEASTGVAIETLTSQGMSVSTVATTGTVASAFKVTDAAHTALTASTERISALFDFGQTRQFATGALTNQRALRVIAPTYSFVAASTIATAATVSISGAPAAGTNATISNALALLIETGAIGLGATPATGGAIRLTNAQLVTSSKTTGGSFTLITLAADNTIYVGDQSVSELNLETQTNIDFDFSGGTNPEYRFTSSAFYLNNNVIVYDAANAAFGKIRFSVSPGVILGYVAHDSTTTKSALSISGDGTTFTDLVVGDDNATTGNATLRAEAKTQLAINIAGSERYSFQSTFANFESAQLRFGAAPSTSALVNASNNSLIVAARGSGAFDVPAVSVDASDHLVIGGSGTNSPSTNYYNTRTAGLHIFQVNAADICSVSASVFDLKSLIAKFGANPSTIALLNFSNNSTIAAGKDSGGTDRNLLVWTSGNVLQVGSGNITSVQLQSTPGNTWTFGSTASFPGVLHALAAGATLAFGTASTNAVVNFAASNTVLLGAKNISSTDRALLTWGSTDALTLGSSALTTIVSASGGSWQFGSTAQFPGVGHNIAASGYLSFGTSPATANGLLRTPHNSAIAYGRNNAATQDSPIARWGVTATDELYLGSTSTDSGKVQTMRLGVHTGGSVQVEVNGVAEYTFDPVSAHFHDNVLRFGSNPATTGVIQVSPTTTIIGAMNHAVTTAYIVLATDASDNIILGNSTDANIETRVASTYNITAGGSTVMQMFATSIVPFVDISFSSLGNVKKVGYLEFLSMTPPSGPGLLGWRLYCDTSGDLIAKSNTGVTRTIALH